MTLLDNLNGLHLNAAGLRKAEPRPPFLTASTYNLSTNCAGTVNMQLDGKSADELRLLADQVEAAWQAFQKGSAS